MYAIIRSGGKQYQVRPGDRIRVERLEGDVGSRILLEDVLMVKRDPDSPVLELGDRAKVAATIEEHGLGGKVLVFKFKRRKRYRRLRGHRQAFTTLRIEEIVSDEDPGRKAKAASPEVKEQKPASEPPTEEQKPEKAAAGKAEKAAPEKKAKAKTAKAKTASKKAKKEAGEEATPKKSAPARKGRKKAESGESDSE